jgi:hypothetical protein
MASWRCTAEKPHMFTRRLCPSCGEIAGSDGHWWKCAGCGVEFYASRCNACAQKGVIAYVGIVRGKQLGRCEFDEHSGTM